MDGAIDNPANPGTGQGGAGEGVQLPALDEIVERARVVSLPMRVRFRDVTRREALLVEGPAGWGEFAPFAEYGDVEAASWLRSALEMAWQGPPRPLRGPTATGTAVAGDGAVGSACRGRGHPRTVPRVPDRQGQGGALAQHTVFAG